MDSVSYAYYNIIYVHITNIMNYVLTVIKYSKTNIRNLLLKKILKNVINITHDNFNTQMKSIKRKCKQITKKSLKPKICILFQ